MGRGLVLAGLWAAAACGADAPEATFTLGFWTETVAGEPVALSDHARLASGAPLAMVLQTNGSCEVYIVFRGADGAVLVLHPPPGVDPRAAGTFEPMPAGTRLDDRPGIESVHVIASRDRQEKLGAAVAAFRPDPRVPAPLLDVLQEVRKRYEGIEVPAPRPALLAGRVRVGEPIFEYDVAPVFCWTFTIDHR